MNERQRMSKKLGFPISQTEPEVECLVKYAKKVPKDRIIIEIGTRNGGSALLLAMNSWNTVITIDILRDPRATKQFGYKEIPLLHKHWARYPGGSRIKQVTCRSWEYHHDGEPVGLVFIDGSHEYEDVERDFELFWGLLMPGGWLLLHDYKVFDGVTQFVADRRQDLWVEEICGSIVVYQKE